MHRISRHLLRMGLLLLLCSASASFFHCDCDNAGEITPAANECSDIREDLDKSDNPAWEKVWEPIEERSKQGVGVDACLQLAYGDAIDSLEAVAIRVKYKSDGQIYGEGDESQWDQPPELTLPAEAKGKKVRTRLFFLGDGNDDASKALCENIAEAPNFDCLKDDKCELMMEFQLGIKGNPPFPIEGVPSTQKCHLTFRDAPTEPDSEPATEPMTEPMTEPATEPDASPDAMPDAMPDETCLTGQIRLCFSHPQNSPPIAPCRKGSQVCKAGLWGPCLGEVLPTDVDCVEGIDSNCDGMIDASKPCKWLRAGGSSGIAKALASFVEPDGSVWITGSLSAGENIFGGGLLNLTPIQHTLLARISPSGVWQSALYLPSPPGVSGMNEGLALAPLSKSSIPALANMVAVVGHFAADLDVPTGRKMAPVLSGNPQAPTKDGYIVLSDGAPGSSGQWIWAQRIGGAGDDAITDVVCCVVDSQNQPLLLAVGVARTLSGAEPKETFTIGRSGKGEAYSFSPDGTTRANSAVFLMAITLDKTIDEQSLRLHLVRIGLWEAPSGELNYKSKLYNTRPRIALVKGTGAGAGANHWAVYISLSAQTVAGNKQLHFFQEKNASFQDVYTMTPTSGDRESYLLRYGVTYSSTGNPSFMRQWVTRLNATPEGTPQGTSPNVTIHSFAAREEKGEVTLALAGSLTGKLVPPDSSNKVTIFGNQSMFVLGVKDHLAPTTSQFQAVWGAYASGNMDNRLNAIAFSSNGSLTLTGQLIGQSLFGNTTVAGGTKSKPHLFMATLSADGKNWLGARGDGGSDGGEDAGHALGWDAKGNFYVIGSSGKEGFFGQKSIGFPQAGSKSSVFVFKNP